MANIELSQEYENLKNEIQELKNTLTETIFKYDELKYIICKNIKTQYMLEIGTLEYLVYKDYCQYLRLKRKAERIRFHKYRHEKIDLKMIDTDLDKEFAEYQKRLDDRAEEITKAAGELEKEVLTTEETREIYLFDTHVAGTTHIEKIKSIEPLLKIGDKVNFYREPTNPHDPQAIRIETTGYQKIGYVPRADNVVFARLMDAGKNLYGKITSKEWQDDWLKVEIRIYLWEI